LADPAAGVAAVAAPTGVPGVVAGVGLGIDRSRRFGSVARLFGDAAVGRLAAAHVVVVGIGGVGSWAVEALARSGVGRLTLIDMDHVAESNINRQVHALESTLGASKVELMAARVRDICADTVVAVVDDFVTADNVAALVPADATVVVDAIDSPRAKAALIAACVRRGQPLVVCGAAGGRTDPLALRRADLEAVRGDALLSSVRNRLRREHGFPRTAGQPFGVVAIHSPAPAGVGGIATQPASVAMLPSGTVVKAPAGAPLACAGYGSIVTVTAAMGMAAASQAIDAVLASPGNKPGLNRGGNRSPAGPRSWSPGTPPPAHAGGSAGST
jgi:tRNA threonylcarbamoyladenosine dehydratase